MTKFNNTNDAYASFSAPGFYSTPMVSYFPTPLSPEYFLALDNATCNSSGYFSLLLLPEFTLTHHHHVSGYTYRSNADSFLGGQVDESLLHESRLSISINPSVHPSQAFQYLAKIAQSNLSLHCSDDMSIKILAQIRNAVAVIAHYPVNARYISKSGILYKLLSFQNGHRNYDPSAMVKAHIHAEFLQCCIFAKQYRFARRHLVPIHMPPPNDEIYLLHHYLQGIIHYESSDLQTAIQQWSRCIIMPANEMSAIVLASWKKMVLAKCLMCQYDIEEELVEYHSTRIKSKGCAGNSTLASNSGSKAGETDTSQKDEMLEGLKEFLVALPLGTSRVIQRFLQKDTPDVQLYKALVAGFVNDDLDWIMHKNAGEEGGNVVGDFFDDDENVDMIKKLVPAMKWRKLRFLSEVYDDIPLGQLGRKLGFGENVQRCKEFLMEVDMIQRLHCSSGSGIGNGNAPIRISIDDEAGVVYFGAENMDGATGDDLMHKIEQCKSLVNRVKQLDVDLTSTYPTLRKNVTKNTEAQNNKDGIGSGIFDSDDGKYPSYMFYY